VRRRSSAVAWPPGLEQCQLDHWRRPTDAGDLAGFEAWSRWVDQRYDHLLSLGFAQSDAQVLAVGDMPRGVAS
jgi:hypothetical protein